MADRKVIQHIDSRLGKRGKREMFDFAGDKAYEKINEYMEELHVTADELNEYKTEAVASADRADAASSAANSAADAASSAASSAADAAQEANKAATAMDEAMEVCNKAAADASGSATVAGESATSAQEAAEEAQKSAERAELAGGVKSFNGRDGAVAPQAGDYTADMVGALAQSDVVSTYSATGTAPVNGQAVAEAISNVKIDTDAELSATSTNPVQNKAIVNGGPAILGALDTTSNTPPDSAYYITSFNDTYRRREFSTLWSYIQGKLSSVLGITAETVTALQKAVEGKADKATTLAGYGITDGASKDLVTTTTNGLMSSSDKTKLDGIDTGATKITVDSALSSSSTNPVQNKTVTNAISKKLDVTNVGNNSKTTSYNTVGLYHGGFTDAPGDSGAAWGAMLVLPMPNPYYVKIFFKQLWNGVIQIYYNNEDEGWVKLH